MERLLEEVRQDLDEDSSILEPPKEPVGPNLNNVKYLEFDAVVPAVNHLFEFELLFLQCNL